MLGNTTRLLMFSLLLVAFLPLLMVGMVGFTVRLKTRNRGISGTAYEPFVNRLLFHHAGTRDDAAAVRLAPHLPALSPTVAWLFIGTIGRILVLFSCLTWSPSRWPSLTSTSRRSSRSDPTRPGSRIHRMRNKL